jgi:gas vesicle protein
MKKSDFKEAIKEEIFEILSEADQEDIDAQADLNKELEATKGHRDDLGDSLSESLNPEVIKAVDRFIKAMAKRYGYGEQDAVFAIQAALKQREFDKPADIPGFEGTMDALNSLTIREDEDEPSAKDVKSSSKDSVSKIANKLQQTTKEMKSVVKKWKNADGSEKDKLTSRLKDLTKIKKELEGLL